MSMEKQQGQKMENKLQSDQEQNKAESLQGLTLPVEDSPYLQYKDLEDYKQKGYGTEGHLQPEPGRGAGATDAPTLSGGSVPRDSDATTIDAITSRPGQGTR